MNDIVVADDNPILVSVLSEIFREYGYTVRTASDGFAALATIRDRVPDILISDLYMPRMTGFELLSIVRRRFPAIAVIAMSGAYTGVIVPEGVAADGFYAKGSSSVARFFDILSAVKDEASRKSARAATPIWIPSMTIELDGLLTVAVACPECLRTFSHCVHAVEFARTERCCPHCLHTMQLAIVGPSADMDKKGLSLSTSGRRMSKSARTR